MTLTPTWFRRLLMLSIATSVAAGLIGEGSVSPTLKLAYDAEPNPWLENHPWSVMALFVVYLAVAVPGLVGLYRFRLWGRSVCLWSTVVGFALYPFMSANLSSPLASAFAEISHLCWGALLALAYFSPLSSAFRDAAPAQAIVPAQSSE